MGLLDRILGTEDSDDDLTEFDEEFDDEWDDEEFMSEDELAEQTQEWENAYDACKDAVKWVGFTDLEEFVAKAAVYRINSSDRYRDRIAVGQETMEMLQDTVGMTRGISGGAQTDWEQAAEKLKGAREVKEEMDKMVDKEEQMAEEILGLAREGIDIVRERGRKSKGGDVDTGTRFSEDNL